MCGSHVTPLFPYHLFTHKASYRSVYSELIIIHCWCCNWILQIVSMFRGPAIACTIEISFYTPNWKCCHEVMYSTSTIIVLVVFDVTTSLMQPAAATRAFNVAHVFYALGFRKPFHILRYSRLYWGFQWLVIGILFIVSLLEGFWRTPKEGELVHIIKKGHVQTIASNRKASLNNIFHIIFIHLQVHLHR